MGVLTVWVFIDLWIYVSGGIWVCGYVFGYLGVSIDGYGGLCISMGVYGSLWVSRACLWGCLWKSMGIGAMGVWVEVEIQRND